jgi:glycosyltransferase involved in cell wall biosynthesis
MKILVIDNLAVASSRRFLYRELSKQITEPVYLLVPQTWREQGVVTSCEEENTGLLKVYSSPFIFGYRHQRIIYTKLKKIISEVQPDIIFISSEPENFNTFHLVFTVRRFFPNIKIVCATWRNIDYRNDPYPYKLGWINRLIEAYTKRRIDICFAHSYTAETLMKDLANWDVVYMPPALNLDNFPYNPKISTEIKQNFVVGYIGRLVSEKGVDTLIRAIRLTEKNVYVHIIGNGPEKDRLKKLADELGINERIKWQDSVEYKDVPNLLKSFNVVVLPSNTTKNWKEQFGRVLIEAMAVGVPVIGSESGEIPDVIGNSGLLFEEGNYKLLSDSINKIQHDIEFRNIIVKKGRERVEKEFSLNVTVRFMIDIFIKSIEHEHKI